VAPHFAPAGDDLHHGHVRHDRREDLCRWSEKGDAAQLALASRLVEEAVEEIDLECLLKSAVRDFDSDAVTIDEQDIEAKWHSHLRHRLTPR